MQKIAYNKNIVCIQNHKKMVQNIHKYMNTKIYHNEGGILL